MGKIGCGGGISNSVTAKKSFSFISLISILVLWHTSLAKRAAIGGLTVVLFTLVVVHIALTQRCDIESDKRRLKQ